MRIHKISRRNFMQITGISALAMGLAACGGSSSSTAASSTASPAASSAAGNASYKITIAHQQDETDSMHLGAVEFQKYVQEKSNGQIEVEIFPNGQLGPEVDIIQSILSQGGCDITFTGETMQTYEPDLGMIGMPYLIQSDEHMDKVLNLPFRDDVAKPNRDNAIDVYIGDTPEDVIGDDVWAETFTEQPAPLTAEEKKEYLSKVTGVCLGSDAFFPFGDNIERAHRSGVEFIAQAGGSIRDDHVIDTCDKYGIAMAFTHVRLFHH